MTPLGNVPLSLMLGAGVPVVVTVNELAVPAVNVVLLLLVMAGAAPLVCGSKTYAEPWNPVDTDAPATIVLPLIATDKPKLSFVAPSEAVSLAVSVSEEGDPVVPQPPAGSTKTYAAPW